MADDERIGEHELPGRNTVTPGRFAAACILAAAAGAVTAALAIGCYRLGAVLFEVLR